MNCESFMDFTYGESDIAIEAFHPIKGLQNLIMKLISAIRRLFNNFKRLRKVTVPEDMAARYQAIAKKIDAMPDNSIVLKKTSDGMYEANISGTNKINQILDEICESDAYKEFMSADKRSTTTPKSNYAEIDSAQPVKNLNEAIKRLTDVKIALNKLENPVSELQNSYKAIIRKYTIEVNICAKLLAFRKPFKDPANDSNVNQLDYKGGKATVYV